MERAEFLAERRVAVLATEEPDGSTYLSAIWFEFVDGAFLVPTGRRSRKARNAFDRPRGSLLVDERAGRFRGVGALGALEVIEGEEAAAINDRIHRRYVTDAGMADPAVGVPLTADDDVTVRLVPERWHEWDLGEEFGPRLADPNLAFPLEP